MAPLTISDRRAAEVAKYEQAYRSKWYAMGGKRLSYVRHRLQVMADHEPFGSFLDVGCGRGEALTAAAELDYDQVAGLEVVDYLCGGGVRLFDGAHSIPYADDSWDVVGCFDVLEHCLEDDVEAILAELVRVARYRVVLTIALFPANLHVTVKSTGWWMDRLAKLPGTCEYPSTYDDQVLVVDVVKAVHPDRIA